jgi:hypothetical protein
MRTFREQRERGDRGTNVREWLTVALLVSTTIGVFWQVREMIKVYAPIQDQAAAAQQSAAAAKQSADAARESADLARNNAEIQLRPYVVIEGKWHPDDVERPGGRSHRQECRTDSRLQGSR